MVAAFGLSFGLSGCDTDDGPAEEMGQAIDDTGENIQDTANKAANAVEDACEDVKEGVDATDTDC
jgi:predicted small secreted protein